MTDFRALCAELHAAFNTYAVDEAHHDLLVRTEAALAQPEPQGPPKNCRLDDEPDLYPGPCVFDVFDDPSDAMGNCVHAQRVKRKTDCKHYRADVQPEPKGLTDEQLIAAAEQAGLCYPRCWDLRGKDAPRLHHLRNFAHAIAAELRGRDQQNTGQEDYEA